MKPYKDINAYVQSLRDGERTKDVIKVKSKGEYTLVNYDMDGHELVYATGGMDSKYRDLDGQKTFIIHTTASRYSDVGFTDAYYSEYQY